MSDFCCVLLTRTHTQMLRVYWISFWLTFGASFSWIVCFLAANGLDAKVWPLALDDATYFCFHICVLPAMVGILLATSAPKLRSPHFLIALAVAATLGSSWGIYEFLTGQRPIYSLRDPEPAFAIQNESKQIRSKLEKLRNAKEKDLFAIEQKEQSHRDTTDKLTKLLAVRDADGNIAINKYNGMPLINELLTAVILTITALWLMRLAHRFWTVAIYPLWKRIVDPGSRNSRELICDRTTALMPDLIIANCAMIWALCRIYANWAQGVPISIEAKQEPALQLVIFILGTVIAITMIIVLLVDDATADILAAPAPNAMGVVDVIIRVTANINKMFGIPIAGAAVLAYIGEPKVLRAFQFYYDASRLYGVPLFFLIGMVMLSLLIGTIGMIGLSRLYFLASVDCLNKLDDLLPRIKTILRQKALDRHVDAKTLDGVKWLVLHLVALSKDELANKFTEKFTTSEIAQIEEALGEKTLSLNEVPDVPLSFWQRLSAGGVNQPNA